MRDVRKRSWRYAFECDIEQNHTHEYISGDSGIKIFLNTHRYKEFGNINFIEDGEVRYVDATGEYFADAKIALVRDNVKPLTIINNDLGNYTIKYEYSYWTWETYV